MLVIFLSFSLKPFSRVHPSPDTKFSIDYLDIVAITTHSSMFNIDTKVHSFSFSLKVDHQHEEDWFYRFNDGWGNFSILSVRTGDTYVYSSSTRPTKTNTACSKVVPPEYAMANGWLSTLLRYCPILINITIVSVHG